MGERPRILIAAAGLVAAAALGAGFALGGVAIFGGFGGRTVVRELADQSAGTASPVAFPQTGKPLTIHEIYRRSAPGVVQHRAGGVQEQRVGDGGGERLHERLAQ